MLTISLAPVTIGLQATREEIVTETIVTKKNEKCNVCHATGDCTECKGTGNGGQCSNCAGTGKCPHCAGSGRLDADQQAR
jgi:RecJ-like exonuclease